MSWEKEPLIHMHGQYCWHDDAYIVANRQGLLALKAAIERALTEDKFGYVESAVVNDGECYQINVIRDDNNLENAAVPYSGEDACEKSRAAVMPFKREEYLRIAEEISKKIKE